MAIITEQPLQQLLGNSAHSLMCLPATSTQQHLQEDKQSTDCLSGQQDKSIVSFASHSLSINHKVLEPITSILARSDITFDSIAKQLQHKARVIEDLPCGARLLTSATYRTTFNTFLALEEEISSQVGPLNQQQGRKLSSEAISLREASRKSVGYDLGAPAHSYAVMFTPSDAATQIAQVADVLGICKRARLSADAAVFVSQHEPQAAVDMWHKLGANVAHVAVNQSGSVNLSMLCAKLQQYRSARVKVVILPATCPKSGAKVDLECAALAVHAQGGLLLTRVGAELPYLDLNLEASSLDGALISLDASVLKPPTPDITILKRDKMPPTQVLPRPSSKSSPKAQDQSYNFRADLESVARCALSLAATSQLGAAAIQARAQKYSAFVHDSLASGAGLCVQQIGPHQPVPAVLFGVQDLGPAFIPAKLVQRMLHDLFGVAVDTVNLDGAEGRLGAAAGSKRGHKPLSTYMRALAKSRSHSFSATEQLLGPQAYGPPLGEKASSLRGGSILTLGGADGELVRVCTHFTLAPVQVAFIVSAVKFVAAHAWQLRVLYRFKEGEWRMRAGVGSGLGGERGGSCTEARVGGQVDPEVNEVYGGYFEVARSAVLRCSGLQVDELNE